MTRQTIAGALTRAASLLMATGLLLGAATAPVSAQTAPTCEPGQRVFDNPLLLEGAICVPEVPSRAAFLDDSVAHALDLGIPSITRSHYSDIIVADFPGLASRLDPATTTDVANTWEMNGEVLLTAQPDLVVTLKYWDVAIALAKDVAPTIIIDDERAQSWVDVPRMLASLFGKETEQAALEAGVDARLAGLREAIAKSDAKTLTFTQIESATSFWTFTREAFGPEFAISAGLAMGPNIPTPEEAAKLPDGSSIALPVSQEKLDLIDADHIFFYSNLGTDPAATVKDNAIFQRFAAARPGRIHFLKGEYWFRGSASSAHRIIDDLYRDVLGLDPAVVSPNPMAWTYQVAAAQ